MQTIDYTNEDEAETAFFWLHHQPAVTEVVMLPTEDGWQVRYRLSTEYPS